MGTNKWLILLGSLICATLKMKSLNDN
jgi:hypothetical protein